MEKNIETKQNKKISLALLVCLVGFPQISETIYTPSLTEIAKSYQVSLNLAQMTLSIYFLSFAIGVFVWGISSDYIGRRKAMNLGILFYILGSIFCLLSKSITGLFIGRFIQAFGASTGSVTTQTILRDHYQGNERHQLFAKISVALAFSPAIGPLIGGILGQYYGFRAVFLVLIVIGLVMLTWSLKKLPETRKGMAASVSIFDVLTIGKKMLRDPYTISFGILIGIFNGLLFSYYSEAPSIFLETFHLSQSQYGLMGCVVASATMLGAWLSNKSLNNKEPLLIIQGGIKLALTGTLILSSVAYLVLPLSLRMIFYIVGIFIILTGISMALPNCLSLALAKYPSYTGTAGAFLSLGYYIIVSLCTFLIGILHTGSLLVFPIFSFVFLCLSFICVKSIK
ncbi:multidrug effflux MFS transporter [Vagococcus sp.]|uniref:multidrug effflux MFS transporter n=1 Tax=Vagococcus sp. TaxID=1933889 RepID=UPI003F9703F7